MQLERSIGTPFAIGLRRTVSIPVGATQLQLGINDDIFIDNTGELNLAVSQSVSVPEPSTIFGLGILGFGAFFQHNLGNLKSRINRTSKQCELLSRSLRASCFNGMRFLPRKIASLTFPLQASVLVPKTVQTSAWAFVERWSHGRSPYFFW
jgi:hypothetical protein